MSYLYAMFPENRIRELRKKAGLTQAELGAKVGLHQTQIGNLENSGRNLTFAWGRRIAKALNATLADILGEQDNPDRLTEEERALVQHFREAAAEQQALIQRVAEPLPDYRAAPSDLHRSAA